jgi:hypothetical protein
VVERGRRRAYTPQQIMADQKGATYAALGETRMHEIALITRRTNASLANDTAKNTLGIALKHLEDARQKLAASTAEAPAPQPEHPAAAAATERAKRPWHSARGDLVTHY